MTGVLLMIASCSPDQGGPTPRAGSATMGVSALPQGDGHGPLVTGPTAAAAPASVSVRQWLSGASGTGVADGTFGRWRGDPVTISGSWSDVGSDEQENLYQFAPGAEYETWSGSMDLGVGAIFPAEGETWAQAADGAYDQRWTSMLERLRSDWESRPRGTLYLRFAQEWNGDFSAWGVDTDDLPAFVATWRRFAALQRQHFPAARLVFCTNGATSGYDYDWRTGWPGDDVVDVYATDWYADEYGSDADLTTTDSHGAPRGLDAHRQFAEQHGKPFALSEWGNHFSAAGDRPDYIAAVARYAADHAGDGPGRLRYEVYFNVEWKPDDYVLYPPDRTLAPSAAAAYRELF